MSHADTQLFSFFHAIYTNLYTVGERRGHIQWKIRSLRGISEETDLRSGHYLNAQTSAPHCLSSAELFGLLHTLRNKARTVHTRDDQVLSVCCIEHVALLQWVASCCVTSLRMVNLHSLSLLQCPSLKKAASLLLLFSLFPWWVFPGKTEHGYSWIKGSWIKGNWYTH